MHVDVNGTRLWFDVDGPVLEPEGNEMRQRPTVVLVHGGPGVYDHSYFKPDFHFTWMEVRHRFWPIIIEFIERASARERPA
jgi:hypothetical protein